MSSAAPGKLNRRTRWKFAKGEVCRQFDADDAAPAWVGPAGRGDRFGTFFGGIDVNTIWAHSKQRYWERLARYIRKTSARAALSETEG